MAIPSPASGFLLRNRQSCQPLFPPTRTAQETTTRASNVDSSREAESKVGRPHLLSAIGGTGDGIVDAGNDKLPDVPRGGWQQPGLAGGRPAESGRYGSAAVARPAWEPSRE